jgi:DNA topoisomerase-1
VARLHRVDPTAPGILRRRRGKGFSYEDARGRRVTDEEALERIRSLAIPPAWSDVWICADVGGHIQATGTDAAGRRQYLYHPAWRQRQDTMKFCRIEMFARALPRMRRSIAEDLALEGLPKERAMACAVRLLDRATFRIGSETYADRNGSFGLATIRKSHVSIDGDTLTFEYPAKSGVQREHHITDPVVAPIVGQLKRRRSGGHELLAYRDGTRWRDIRSDDINSYLKAALGEEHSAKDFRTWHATVLAAVDLAREPTTGGTRTARKRRIAATVRRVADHMGNTPAVCRASYIDPRVFDRFTEGLVVDLTQLDVDRIDGDDEAREGVERAVLDLLEDDGAAAVAA